MPRRILQGRVVSHKMDKTVTVLVERKTMHPIYKKYVKQSSKYAAHDENNAFRAGDMVQIEECRPLSKRKTWQVITDPATIKRSEVDVAADELAASAARAAKSAATKKKAAAKKKK